MCRRCGEKLEETVSTRFETISYADCEHDGESRYVAEFENELFETQTKTIIIPALGHKYELNKWNWDDDYSKAAAVFVCSLDPDHIREIPANITVTENDSAYVYTAVLVFEGRTYTDTKTQSKAALPESIVLSESNVQIESGKTLRLNATVKPEDSKDKSVKWSSSDEKIATVDNKGIVKGIKPGYATITAATVNGLTATCEIRVVFTDVPAEGVYYSNPVYWAVEKGITNGYTDSDGIIRTFKPKNNCTREAVVTFLWRLAGKPDPKNMNSPFSDVQDRNKYYYKAVLWAAELGITKGYADGSFKPNATCLREHVVTFLWRYAKQPAPKTTKNPFNDVKTSDYYYKATLWANENKIANGYSTGEHAGGFGPKLDCLREHVVTFLYRFAN